VPADELSAGRRADDEADDTPGLDPVAVLEVLRLGEVDVLGRMPWSSNTTLLVAMCHDDRRLRAVYKPRRGERPLWDFPAGLDRREVAAYELSAWLGWDLVPETILRHDGLPLGTGSLQRFVPFDVDQHYFTLVEDEAHRAALQAMCAFDLVANSADRKGGHCLAGTDGRVYGVDNGLTFHCELKLRTVIWEFGGQPVPPGLLADLGRLAEAGAPPALDELLSDGERRALEQRAEAVVAGGAFPIDRTGRRYPWPLV
jgi:uncharacterized repeat protein (TIGR03843 family)